MPPPGPFTFDPREPLARLVLKEWALRTVKDVLDKIPPGILKAILATAKPWDAAKLTDIKSKFLPKEPKNGMGCMAACYDMLSILYSPKVKGELLGEVLKRALVKAEAYAKANPGALKKLMDQAKADAAAKGKTLTDAQARHAAIWELTSPHNSADHLFKLMQEKGMASEPVALNYQRKSASWSPDAEQAISGMTGDQPGTYFFGLSVSDYHTVTLAVERKDDGTQKMYWFDQHQKGLSGEIAPGKLGETLQAVRGTESRTTRIWSFQPPTPAN